MKPSHICLNKTRKVIRTLILLGNVSDFIKIIPHCERFCREKSMGNGVRVPDRGALLP